MKPKIQNAKFKILIIPISFLCLLAIAPSAFAHKVNIFAYVEGDSIYTESYFSDGKKVKNGIIEVYDSQGKKLFEGITDNDGRFHFKPTKKDDLKIIINASMGHKNSYMLSADEFSEGIETQTGEMSQSDGKISQIDITQIKRIVDSSLGQKLKPIMRKLVALERRKISCTEVIGGIGYIFGMAGIIFYFLSKKRDD